MLGAELDLFGGALVKRNSQGQYVPIEPKDLAGVSVALYFGKKNHTKSAAVASVLKQFYLTTNCNYQPKSVEVIYVSLDEDEKTFEEARAQMPWCSVEYRSDLRKNLINRYKISDHFLAFRKAKIPTTQCPHIIIIGPHGEEAGRLDVSKGGPEAFLLNWDYRYNRWPGTPSIPSTPSTASGTALLGKSQGSAAMYDRAGEAEECCPKSMGARAVRYRAWAFLLGILRGVGMPKRLCDEDMILYVYILYTRSS